MRRLESNVAEKTVSSRRCVRLGLGALLALAWISCAGKAPIQSPELMKLQWPEAPLEARILLDRIYATDTDLGIEKTRMESLMQFLTGAVPPRSHVYQPMDIAVSDDGQRIYVADFGQMLVFMFDTSTRELKLIGLEKPFRMPFGVALDSEEKLYVSEQGARRITVLDRNLEVENIIAHESLIRPADVEVDRVRGRIYVADPSRQVSDDHSVKIFDMEGNLIGKLGAGKGTCNGCLFFPTYLALDPDGNVYVTSTLKSKVDKFDPEGHYVRSFGDRGNAFGLFDKPKGVALDSFGNVYVVDSGWSNVQIFNQNGDVLLFFGGRGVYPGLLRNPTAIAIDPENRIYVGDYLNYRVNSYRLVNTEPEDSFAQPSSDGTSDSLSPAATSAPPERGPMNPQRSERR